MRAKFFATFTLLSMSAALFGQEEQWESQFKLTGYVATEYEYFKDLDFFTKDYAFSISEGGLLANYQPIEKLTIKSVFVYRPGYSFDNMLNEANAEYKFSDYFNAKVGRFLTPLSPMNTYYYAPVNNSSTLPLMISHHEFFPLNIDALSFNGKIGDEFKFKYEAFFGGFRNALWLKTGSLGLFGYEDKYLVKDGSALDVPEVNSELNFGGGGQIGIAYQDYLNLGFGIFKSEDPFFEPNSQMTFIAKKNSYGFNLKAKLSTLQLLSEVWHAKVNIPIPMIGDLFYDGGFVELSNTFNKITPYARFEYHDAAGMKFNRYTAGINYRPMFETTMKLEYVNYDHELTDLSGIVATLIFSF